MLRMPSFTLQGTMDEVIVPSNLIKTYVKQSAHVIMRSLSKSIYQAEVNCISVRGMLLCCS